MSEAEKISIRNLSIRLARELSLIRNQKQEIDPDLSYFPLILLILNSCYNE